MTYPGAFPGSTTYSSSGAASPALTALPVTWALDNITFGAADEFGCWWIVKSSNGWYGPPKPKTQRQIKSNAAGSFRSSAFRGERVVSLTGHTKCPDPIAREAAADRLAAMAADPTVLYELIVTERTGQARTLGVELDSQTDVKLASTGWLDWQLQVGAPDPLKHDAVWQAPRSGMLTTPSAGLDFGTKGLSFAPVGLDFGAPGTGLPSQVANFGTATTYPVFEITGPAVNPQIVDLDTGDVVSYAGTLYTGDTLTINCGEFVARGFPSRSCYLNTFTDQRVYLSVPAQWPSVRAGEVHTYGLRGVGPVATLTTYLRSAWY